MTDKIEWHLVEDGSLYAVEIASPEVEVNGSNYKVDLVRATLDDSGLEREQRLGLGQYPSWSEAEAHQREVEKVLDEKGLAGLADAAQLIAEQPYQDTISYVYGLNTPLVSPDRPTFEPEVPSDDWLDAAMIEDWKRESVEPSIMPMTELGFGGSESQIALKETQVGSLAWDNGFDLAETAQVDVIREASPELPFAFGEDMTPYDNSGNPLTHHVDAGATVHWVAITENAEAAAEPYQLRYHRALVSEERMLKHDSYPIMPLLDNNPDSAWPMPGLEMLLKSGDVLTTQQLAHDVATNYGYGFPTPQSLPALDLQPDYHFGYGVGPNNVPSLDAVKTWMSGTERCFDTLTIAEFDTWDASQADESQLSEVLRTQGLEAAMNLAESKSEAGGFLDPNRSDGRIFFQEDAPTDPFTTNRERELDANVRYEFDYNLFGEESLSLEAHKFWRDLEGDEHSDLLLLDVQSGEGDGQLLQHFEREVERLREIQTTQGLEQAMNEAERMAIANDLLDAERADPRLFMQGPPDPFTTLRERELTQAQMEMDTEPFTPITSVPDAGEQPDIYQEAASAAMREREANAGLEGSAWFEATFENSPRELLQPVHDTVNYAVVVNAADPQTLELAVEKYWKEPGGYLGVESLTLDNYDVDDGREEAFSKQYELLETHEMLGLESLMNQAELLAMEKGTIDGERIDLRLFRHGPPDRFATLAQQLEGETNPYWNTSGEQIEVPASQDESAPKEIPTWEMEMRPAVTPDGQPLGTALFMTVYPADFQDLRDPRDVPANQRSEHDEHLLVMRQFDALDPHDRLEDVDTSRFQAQVLEIGHFENDHGAEQFIAEFNGYVIPGVVDGTELAAEAAKLNGLSGNWQSLNGDGLTQFMDHREAVVREPDNWHLYGPNNEPNTVIGTKTEIMGDNTGDYSVSSNLSIDI